MRSWRSRWSVGMALVGLFVAGALVAPGALAVTGGPSVIAVSRAGPVNIHGGGVFGNVASITLPAGRWLVTATGAVTNASASSATATCQLVTGADIDTAKAQNGDLALSGGSTPLALMNAHSYGAAGSAKLRCKSGAATGIQQLSSIRLAAMKVGKLTRRAAGGSPVTTGTGIPRVLLTFRDGDAALPGDSSYHNLASVSVPAGRWVFFGKVQVASGSTPTTTTIDCELFTPIEFDHTVINVTGTADRAPIALQQEHAFSAPGSATLACKSSAPFHASLVKIAAIKGGVVAKTDIDGGSDGGQGSGNPYIAFGLSNTPHLITPGGTFASVGSITTLPGNWTASAKLFVIATPFNAAQSYSVQCRLTMGTDTDTETVELSSGPGFLQVEFALQTVHHFDTGGTAGVDCAVTGGLGQVHSHFLRITAIRAGSLTNTSL